MPHFDLHVVEPYRRRIRERIQNGSSFMYLPLTKRLVLRHPIQRLLMKHKWLRQALCVTMSNDEGDEH